MPALAAAGTREAEQQFRRVIGHAALAKLAVAIEPELTLPQPNPIQTEEAAIVASSLVTNRTATQVQHPPRLCSLAKVVPDLGATREDPGLGAFQTEVGVNGWCRGPDDGPMPGPGDAGSRAGVDGRKRGCGCRGR